MTTESSAQAEE